MKYYLILLALIILAWVPLANANPVVRAHTIVQLVSESRSIAPKQNIALAIRMTPKPGWHTYYKNFGDTGLETSAQWQLPPGFSASALAYPTPTRIATGDLINFGYNGPSTLLLRLKAPAQITADIIPVSLQLNWLVCSDEICVPEEAELKLRLLRGESAPDAAQAKLFAEARAALPKEVPWPARYATSGNSFRLQVSLGDGLPAIEQALFFPTQAAVMANAAPQKFEYRSGTLQLETGSALQGAAPATLDGVLAIKTKGNPATEGFAIRATHADNLAGTQSANALTPLVAIAFALLGGLLLNLMPCVFPILSLKALSLARSGSSVAQAKSDSLWYSLGVVATFVALAMLLFALRAAGQNIGWGFQLQDPRVVALLALLMVLVALNLFGVFEVNTQFAGAGQRLTEKPGSSGAFWTGALAVLVATPCTAPFMAGALGAAFALPPVVGVLIFTSLGIGMALPFLLLGFVPAMRRWLPRPGAWMAGFKTFLGFPMLATAIWLLWVVGQQAGLTAIVKLLVAALLLSLGAWLYGRSPDRWTWRKALGAALVAVTALALPLNLAAEKSAAKNSNSTLAGSAYSEAALAAAQATGKPVFVYFTADWCISCKVNERTTLADKDVQQALATAGTTILVGDWTNRDDMIANTLTRYGRSGVPLYLWFPANQREAEILPQILSPGMMLKTIHAK